MLTCNRQPRFPRPAALGALIALPCLLTFGCFESDDAPSRAGIRLGALLPYTGELAASGHSLEQGMTLAVETVNRAGGVAGQPLVLEIQDTHSDLVRGQASAERLFAQRVSAIVGPEGPALAR